ncbi:MAG: PilZN3 domain-containing protein, partial [Spirochaetia bacterium]
YAVSDKADPVSFFVTAKITGIKPYSKENNNLSFIALSFTQQPPDDLILMLGELLEVGRTFQKRKEERIIVNTDAMRKMGIKSKDVTAHVQGVPRKCILRDVSFSGAKILMLGVAKFLQDKPVSIRIFCRDPEETISLEGKVVRTELVEGRKDIAAVAISFPEDKIPANYKLRVHNYLKNIKHKEPPTSEN